MSKLSKRTWIALILVGGMASAATAMTADRSADEILKALDAVKMPAFDASKRSDSNYIQEVRKQFKEAGERRDTLILELYKADPNSPKLAPLMAEHWERMVPFGPDAKKRETEIKDVLEHTKSPKLKLEALFAQAQGGIYKARTGGTADLSGVDEFIKQAPKDPRGAQLLYVATYFTKDEKVKAEIEDKILKQFPDSSFAASIEGGRRQKDAVGKPFELEFTDAINGSTVSMKNLKGKVVVVDFWATWCGPCVAEMPHMKELYAKYHDQGVEFIGVSLDQPKDRGGLDSLKKYVKDNEIAWPQYYQGKGWESEFSRSWGINAIPAMFVVNQDGKLHSIEARGKLEEMLPSLLKKKAEGVGARSGGGE